MKIAQDLLFSQQALMTLFAVTNKLQMQGDKYLQEITLRQMLAIPAIIHAPEGNATINHIARQLGTTKQSAKQIVDAMAKKGYLAVAPSEQDKRAVNVTITREGEQAFRACSERTDEFLAELFHDFTTEDLATFCTLLQKLYRFDGVQPEDFHEHKNDHAANADEILKYHPNFLKKRTQSYKKASK